MFILYQSFSLKVKKIYVGFGNGNIRSSVSLIKGLQQELVFFRQSTDLILLCKVLFNEVIDIQEGRFPSQNTEDTQTLNISHLTKAERAF